MSVEFEDPGPCPASLTEEDAVLGPLVARLNRVCEPARDLWPEIGRAIGRRQERRPRWTTGGREAVAAAAALALLVAGVFLGPRARHGNGSSTDNARTSWAGAAPVTLWRAMEQEGAGARREWRAAVLTGEGSLSPDLVRAVETDLRILDRAMEETAGAMAQDPGNPHFVTRLADYHRRRMRLVERALGV